MNRIRALAMASPRSLSLALPSPVPTMFRLPPRSPHPILSYPVSGSFLFLSFTPYCVCAVEGEADLGFIIISSVNDSEFARVS